MADPANAPLVVFDLDGTLVDTAPDLIDTLNVILAREKLAPVAYDVARVMIGGGARVLIERGLSAACRDCGKAEIDRLYTDFVAYYADHLADRSQPFPGALEAMDRLAADGFRLAICTNKLEGLSVSLINALGLAPRFAAICGQDTFAVAKPDPAFLLKTIARAGGTATRTVMVGDSAADIGVARAAKVPVIAVDFGYTDIPVSQMQPDRIISHFSQLCTAVEDVIGH
jgi:phosphoglycolate phosphatase